MQSAWKSWPRRLSQFLLVIFLICVMWTHAGEHVHINQFSISFRKKYSIALVLPFSNNASRFSCSFFWLSTFHSIVNSCFYRFVMYWFKLIKVCYKHWRRMIFTTEKLWNGSLDLFFFVCVPLPVVHNVLWQADVNIEVWYKHYYISQSVGTYDWSN